MLRNKTKNVRCDKCMTQEKGRKQRHKVCQGLGGVGPRLIRIEVLPVKKREDRKE